MLFVSSTFNSVGQQHPIEVICQFVSTGSSSLGLIRVRVREGYRLYIANDDISFLRK